MQFHPFFIECSIREDDNIIQKLYNLLATNTGGGLIIKRGHNYYLSLDDNTEFKIPFEYNKIDHARLNDVINKHRTRAVR